MKSLTLVKLFGVVAITICAILETSGTINSFKFAKVFDNFKANLTASMLLSEKPVESTKACSRLCFSSTRCYGFGVSPYVTTAFQTSGVRSSVLCRLINGDGIAFDVSKIPRVTEAESGIYWIQQSASSKLPAAVLKDTLLILDLGRSKITFI
jgi:hypothetical protein